jgi:hypothetical protein
MASGNNYHSQAVEKVRTFIRLLGSSLSKKNSNTLPESARTYSMFAKQEFCEGEPLIPKPEEDQILAASGDAPIVGCWTRCRAYTSTLGCAIFCGSSAGDNINSLQGRTRGDNPNRSRV